MTTKFTSTDKLIATKARLGPMIFMDFTALDFTVAHRKLGEEVREQVQKILRRKLDNLTDEQIREQIRLVRQCGSAIKEKLLSSQIDYRIQNCLKSYLACLSAWADGVQLHTFQHPRLRNIVIDKQPISSDDLSLLLQNDSSGCQTGVYREKDGSVILWHTEEDVEDEPGDRFDKLRLACFQSGENEQVQKIYAFVYPDLLPGPAYCWRNDSFVQAVDSLYVKSFHNTPKMLANIATWITLWLGKEAEPEEIIEALGPFVDGYALTIVQSKNEQIFAKKVEFAGDQIFASLLESSSCNFLFQVNIFSEKEGSMATIYEEIDSTTRKFFEKRISRTERVLKRIQPTKDALPYFFRLLSSRVGEDYAYANESVKSYFVSRTFYDKTEIWVGAGPALKEDKMEFVTLLT